MDRFTAFFDANVLYPAALRNLLMRLTVRGLFRAKWSDAVHEEWMRSVMLDYPDITRSQLERTRDLMNRHAEDSLVTGFEQLIPGLSLPDSGDRHVLAAAIRTNADVIVTRNLQDFPDACLHPYGIEPQHPDTFIMDLFDLAPGAVVSAVREHRESLKNPPKTVDAFLGVLERQGLTQTALALRDYKSVL